MTLRLRRVAKSYGATQVLHDIDLDVKAGETVAVVGPNGAGKTTLLRLAAGVMRPTKGAVTLDGGPIAGTHRPMYAGPEPGLYDELSPIDHLSWWGRMVPGGPEPTRALAHWGLARRASVPCRDLSSGQRQRLALAMAFASRSRWIVADEPFQNLDAAGAAIVDQAIAVHPSGILVAMHDVSHANAIADRVIRITGRHAEDV